VRLKSVWDKRLVVSNSYLLRNGDEGLQKVFVSADEPPEVRRKKTLTRLKQRAQRNGQQVEENDGCLYVDGILVYSVKKVSSGVSQING